MKRNKIVFALVLVVLGILSRTIFHIGPNIEFITAIAIVAGLLFKGMWSYIIPLCIMLFSDLIIGNSNIFLFTWSGFLIPVILGKLLNKLSLKWNINKYLYLALGSELTGIAGTVFFFIWTNFGHWLTTNMYTKDFSGLIQSYINGLPFLKPQLSANLIIVPLITLASVFALNFAQVKLEKMKYQ